jgi:hypothetical protein
MDGGWNYPRSRRKSMASRDLKIYYQRWQALDNLIADSIVIYRGYTLVQFPRRDTILHLLKSLQEFAKGQFTFFYFGFGFEYDDEKRLPCDPLLQPWDEYPPEDLLSLMLDQIGHDLALIQRAADQRATGSDKVKKTLERADQLAWSAVKPAIDYGVVDKKTTVLTYFEKSAEFFRIPYAHVALISIPFTCTSDNPRDLLAIPHEVGHYVYRRFSDEARRFVRDDLRKLLDSPQLTPEYRGWIKGIFEETFADIYGCLIAGPVMALDFESLSLENSQKDFLEGDAKHPNPAIRPLVYCRVLASKGFRNLINGDWQTIGNELSARWDRSLTERHVSDFVIKTTRPQGQNEVIDSRLHKIGDAIVSKSRVKSGPGLDPLGKVVSGIVDTIMGHILDYVSRRKPLTRIRRRPGWAGKLTKTTTPEELFANYKKYIDQMEKEPPKDELMQPDRYRSTVRASKRDACFHAPPSWRKWLQEENRHIVDPYTSKLWSDWLSGTGPRFKGGWPNTEQILCGEAKDPDKMEPGTWGYIYYADGWALGGPSSNDHGIPLL